MRIEIFNVGHGHCSLITAPNGERILLDCGFGSDPVWFPSIAFFGEFIELMAVLNLDEDHLDDLPDTLKHVRIGAFYSNPTVTAAALAEMKKETGGMNAGVAAAHSILTAYGSGVIGQVPIDAGEVAAWTYFNRYGWDFTTTNNLSLAVFVRYGGTTFLFAGDLEAAAWRKLMERPQFCADLATVKVIVAAHHGRDSGFCSEVFEICRPEIVVISDDAKQYDSQETHGQFYRRTLGIPDLGNGNALTGYGRRHVFTTRNDGKVTLDVQANGRYLVTPEYGRPRLRANPLALPFRPTYLRSQFG